MPQAQNFALAGVAGYIAPGHLQAILAEQLGLRVNSGHPPRPEYKRFVNQHPRYS